MNDLVFKGFLDKQFEEGRELEGQSDLVSLQPIERGADPPDRYVVQFGCKGLVRRPDGQIGVASGFAVGIWFPSTYLRGADPFQVLTWLGPGNIFHPNIAPPLICVGRLVPGTELVDLIYQCYEIITYFNWAPHDALNGEASQWARNHQERFPVDRRPLKRRALNLKITEKGKKGDKAKTS